MHLSAKPDSKCPLFFFVAVVSCISLSWTARSLIAADPLTRVGVNSADSNPFDGKSLAAWTTPDGKPITQGWEVIDGMIHLKKNAKGAGNIVTATEFGNFSLSFEWKIGTGGNNGIKYRVNRYGQRLLGCEYQVYDDNGPKKVAPKNSSGALYDLYEPSSAKKLNPTGEWNQSKIVSFDNRIEHWLNGIQVVTATVGDSEWKKRIGESKFNEYAGFSEKPTGKLMLTDHGSEVWYRNFTFEPLTDAVKP